MKFIEAIIAIFEWIFNPSPKKSKAQNSQRSQPQILNTSVQMQQKDPLQGYRYSRKYLLTKNEYYFYKSLKPVADKLGYGVLAKIRMADLVKPDYPEHWKQYYGAFQKIKAKHVDFALVNPENCAVELLIELDDNSHDNADGKARDEFTDAVYASCGYRVLHTRGTGDLETRISQILAH